LKTINKKQIKTYTLKIEKKMDSFSRQFSNTNNQSGFGFESQMNPTTRFGSSNTRTMSKMPNRRNKRKRRQNDSLGRVDAFEQTSSQEKDKKRIILNNRQPIEKKRILDNGQPISSGGEDSSEDEMEIEVLDDLTRRFQKFRPYSVIDVLLNDQREQQKNWFPEIYYTKQQIYQRRNDFMNAGF